MFYGDLKGEENFKKKTKEGYMYTYICLTTLLYSRNRHGSEKQLYSNGKKKIQPTSSWKLTIGQLLTHNYVQIIIWGIALC